MRKWAAEVAAHARFASALPPEEAAANPGSLPVPCLVINNKADLRGAQSFPFCQQLMFIVAVLHQQTQPCQKLMGACSFTDTARMPCESCHHSLCSCSLKGFARLEEQAVACNST